MCVCVSQSVSLFFKGKGGFFCGQKESQSGSLSFSCSKTLPVPSGFPSSFGERIKNTRRNFFSLINVSDLPRMHSLTHTLYKKRQKKRAPEPPFFAKITTKIEREREREMASSSRSGRETKSAAFLFAPGVKVGGGGGETRRGTTKTPRRWRMPFEEKGKGHLDDGAHYGGKKERGEFSRRRRRRRRVDATADPESTMNNNNNVRFLAAASVASLEGGRGALQKSWLSMRASWGDAFSGKRSERSSGSSGSRSNSSRSSSSGSSSSNASTRGRRGSSSSSSSKKKSTNNNTNNANNELTQREKINRRLFAGTMSTICVRTLLAPLERLKTEYLFNNSKEALFVTSKIVFKNEGVIGFWKGNLVNIVRTAPFKAINFSAFDTVRTAITKTFDVKENTVADEISLSLSGAFACGTAVTICYPMDVVRTRLVVRGGTQKYKNIFSCVRILYKEEGLASFYRGILPAMAQMTPNAAVYYSVYNSLKQYRLTQMKYEEEEKEKKKKRKKRESSKKRNAKDDNMGGLNKRTIEPQYMMLFGMAAGIASESFTFPLEVARRRIQMNTGRVVAKDIFGSKELKMMLEVTQKVLRENGFRGLYAGLAPSVLQVLPSAALGYYCYESFKLAVAVD